MRGTDLIAGTNSGVYISTDNGNTWIKKSNGLQTGDVKSVAAKGDTLIAAIYDAGNLVPVGISISTNNGISWSSFDGAIKPFAVRTVAISGSTVYAGTGTESIWKSSLSASSVVASGLTTITTSAVSPLNYCAGTSVTVSYTTNGTANAGNVFTAQLSNALGSFASPVAIGTLTSTAAGTIAATIPLNTTAGSGYRIRVISSTPIVTGSDNGSNITVNASATASTITAGSATTFCSGGSVLLSGNTTGGTWSVGGGTSATLSATTGGDYFVTTTNGCGSVTSNHIIVTVTTNATPGTITGITSPCPSTTQTYTVKAVNGTTYNWRVPSTVSIASGQGTNTVQLQFKSTFNGGKISVSATTACGTSAARSLALSKCAALARPLSTEITTIIIASEGSIYPNPSDGNFRISFNTDINISAIARIEIMNECGQVVYQSNEKSNNGVINVNLQQKLANGIYLVSCTVPGEKMVKKLIINK